MGRAEVVAGARRSLVRRRVVAVVNVAEALRRPSTNEMHQGVHTVVANTTRSEREQGALEVYQYSSSELGGAAVVCRGGRR